MSDSPSRRGLLRLLAAIAAAERGQAFLAGIGAPGPGRRWPGGVLASDPADPVVASVEAVPWPEGDMGVVEVTFRPGAAPTWPDLQAWFPSLEELPLLDDAPAEYIADWVVPGAPAHLALIAAAPERAGDVVHRLTVRRDPVRSGR